MSLVVIVKSAANVPHQKSGAADPYIQLTFRQDKSKTKHQEATENPVYNEEFTFDLGQTGTLARADVLIVKLYDREKIGSDKCFGEAKVPLGSLKPNRSEQKTVTFGSTGKGKEQGGQATATLELKYNSLSDDDMGDNNDPSPNSAGGGDEEEEEEEDEEEEEIGEDGEVLVAEPGTGKKVKGKPKAKKSKKKRTGTDVNPALQNLSKKKQDFQIRIKLYSGKGLQGSNISPLAKIQLAGSIRQTKIAKSTNSPQFNESFFFNLNMSPADLVEQILDFDVLDSKGALRSDSLIGTYKCDLGLIYGEPKHYTLNRWLLLTDPEDSSPKGYLKFSAVILGPGDEAPSMAEDMDDDMDIEKKLLRPAGSQLAPATMAVRVYQAADIPNMDPDSPMGALKGLIGKKEKKDKVDPFLMLQFAGKTLRTNKIVSEANPEWNEELFVGFQFPTMSDKVRLMLYDWDRIGGNDIIATAIIPLQSVSAPGSSEDGGFLPTFGPSWVNFYGDCREKGEDLIQEFEDLNKAKGEGIAYRGRALIELKLKLGESPAVPSQPIPSDDIMQMTRFKRRKNFLVHGIFYEGNMICIDDVPIEFEVSMGNYGNKLDEASPPTACSTQAVNAVYDGTFYHFVPWAQGKPCVSVECKWENMTTRLEQLNYLLNTKENYAGFLAEVEALQNTMPTETLSEADLRLQTFRAMNTALEQLEKDLQNEFPLMEISMMNELDKSFHTYRETEMEYIREQLKTLRGLVLAELHTDKGETIIEIDGGGLSAPKSKMTGSLLSLPKSLTGSKSSLVSRTKPEPAKASEIVGDMQGLLNTLSNIAYEPQNVFPDIIVWMLKGTDRVAYARIPANDLYYSEKPICRGRRCGVLQTLPLKLPSMKKSDKSKWIVPCLLRCKFWFGHHTNQHTWFTSQADGSFATFAECVEIQKRKLPTGTFGPKSEYKDSTQKISIKKETFAAPDGWSWAGDWEVSVEASQCFEEDEGHASFLEEVFEHVTRMNFGLEWRPNNPHYRTIKNDPAAAMTDVVELKDFPCPESWEWKDNAWQVDTNRNVDEEGWEFAVNEEMGGWTSDEKMHHLVRRRRWVRTRVRLATEEVDAKKVEKRKKLEEAKAEGWMYGKTDDSDKYHPLPKSLDFCRKRSHRRKMLADKPGLPCLLRVETEKSAETILTPQLVFEMAQTHKYQLRAYLYQGRDLIPADDDGLSADPFARVSFLSRSGVTERLESTLCPSWDQTLILDEIEIHGDPMVISNNPPEIVVEIFDWDRVGKPDFLGRCFAKPTVRLEKVQKENKVRLAWYEVHHPLGFPGGEILAAFELFIKEDDVVPFEPPKKKGSTTLFQVPSGIRPSVKRTGVEFLCWGVRNMRSLQLLSVTSPVVEVEINNHFMTSEIIRNTKKQPNFNNPVMFFDIFLPVEDMYTPPVNIRVKDNRQFGRKPLAGTAIIKHIHQYKRPKEGEIQLPKKLLALVSGDRSAARPSDVSINMDAGDADKKMTKAFSSGVADDTTIDWWSKYYASIGKLELAGGYLALGYDTLEVFPCELENVAKFNGMTDFVQTWELMRGKKTDDDNDDIAGELKGAFCVYEIEDQAAPKPLPEEQRFFSPSLLPPSDPIECTVRVYIISCSDLQPNDSSGLADPYVKLELGKKTYDNKEGRVLNSINPVFGRVFEMTAKIPLEKDLTVTVLDWDQIGQDDVIGETVIDLENRLFSKVRAHCGLSRSYATEGICQWRDGLKPLEILHWACQKHRLPQPVLTTEDGEPTIAIAQYKFTLADFRPPATAPGSGAVSLGGNEMEPLLNGHAATGSATTGPSAQDHATDKSQQLALHMCHAFGLVSEHVETRPLYSDIQPGIEQGRLQMWVDIFPLLPGFENQPGSAVDITPRIASKFELRVVIYNTVDVILEEESVTGEKMSDIYVKGWIDGLDEDIQETDVHYRSLDGDGNFNWRLIFNFDYLPAENKIVVAKKTSFFSMSETISKVTPRLMIQIWDNDMFSADDYIGQVELDLGNLEKPVQKPSKCGLENLRQFSKAPKELPMVNIFQARRTKGFWPCYQLEDPNKKDKLDDPVKAGCCFCCRGGGKENREEALSNDPNNPQKAILAGKVEMEIELLTVEETVGKESGKARDEPNAHPTLGEPNRPATSFLWITSPWKTFKHIIWKNFKGYFFMGLLILLLGLLIFLVIYTAPGAITNRIINPAS